jgi:hypothetical protein
LAVKQKMVCFALVASAVLGQLSGCAGLNDRGQRLLGSKVVAYAIVNGQLVTGEMELFTSHTGTVTLRLETVPGKTPLTSCVGRFRYTGTTMGTVDLRCNDGTVADLSMALMGDTRGYGYGQTAAGLASLTFGLTPADAMAHLTAPPNMKLLVRTDTDGLELK